MRLYISSCQAHPARSAADRIDAEKFAGGRGRRGLRGVNGSCLGPQIEVEPKYGAFPPLRESVTNKHQRCHRSARRGLSPLRRPVAHLLCVHLPRAQKPRSCDRAQLIAEAAADRMPEATAEHTVPHGGEMEAVDRPPAEPGGCAGIGDRAVAVPEADGAGCTRNPL